MDKKKIVVSGIRATGKLHLGNYLGVLERMATMSKDDRYKCYFFVADLHSLTTLSNSRLIKEFLPDIIMDYLAAGVDYNKSLIYIQSSVPSVTELAWYLACMCPAGELSGQPAYRDKLSRNSQDNNTGLLTYPVLMAADILGPRANLVPVGLDQKAHLELACKLAKKFNSLFKDYFPIPDAMPSDMITVPGLGASDENGRFPKMGKSDKNTINLSDSQDMILKKILSSPTDPYRVRLGDKGNPNNCAIAKLHGFVSQGIFAEIEAKCKDATIGCVECKNILASNTKVLLQGFNERRKEFEQNPKLVNEIINDGQIGANKIFAETLKNVREMIGVKYL